MPKFKVTTNSGGETDGDAEPLEFPDLKAATDDAQVALADMAREKLPNGKHAEFGVRVEDERGRKVYQASLDFEAKVEGDIEDTQSS